MKIIRLSFLTAVWLMTAHRLPAPIRSVWKNHSIGERPNSRYAGFCIPVDEESDIADCDIEGTEFMSIGPDFKSFYMKIPASWSNVEDMVKGFAKAALKHWFKHATRADLANPQIYESVRLTLARNFRSTWKIRANRRAYVNAPLTLDRVQHWFEQAQPSKFVNSEPALSTA